MGGNRSANFNTSLRIFFALPAAPTVKSAVRSAQRPEGKAIFSWWSSVKSRSNVSLGKKRNLVVTPGRRKFIQYKEKYGFTGLLIVAGLLSVPISAMLGAKYFSKKKNSVLYLILAFFAWSCVLTFLSLCVKNGVL